MSTNIPDDVREVIAAVADELRQGPQAADTCSHVDVHTRIAVEATRRTAYPLATTHVAATLLPDVPAGITNTEFAGLLTDLLDEELDQEQGGGR